MFSWLWNWNRKGSYEPVPEDLRQKKFNPEKHASFISKITYSWFNSVIILGYKKPLEREDLFELNDNDSSYNVCPIFEKQWRRNMLMNKKNKKKEAKTKKPSLLHALWNTFKFLLIQVALFKIFADILSFISPLIMKQMILFCENRLDLVWNGYGYAVALFVVTILQTLVYQQYQRFNMLNSAKIKTAVIGLLYKKALNLSNSSRKKFSSGEIINLMSADAQQLMDLTVNLNILWSAPLQILMAILLLWQELGPSAFAGVVILVLVIAINALAANRIKVLKKSQMKNKDQQIKLLNEILQGIKTKISLGRLQDFLHAEELNPENIESHCPRNFAVEFMDASFTWENGQPPILNDLNIKIPEGTLMAIIGQVGSGKSSVLSAILGEMEKLKGTIQRKGSVAYVSQHAWIQNSKLQENILFGSVMQKQYYERVLEACALLPDLEQFPNGDQTEIGERGVNISGGQKQRVSLARAVYNDADIYLLDDPLSAVDVHVGKHLFEKVIGSSGLLKNKTRILVTHNLALLPQADLILVMESGRVAQIGSYHELLLKVTDFTNLLQISSISEKVCPSKEVNQRNFRTISKDKIMEQASFALEEEKCFSMKKEKIPTSDVKFSSIVKYLQAFGWLWVWLCVTAYLGQNLVSIGQNLWLSTWIKEAKHVKDIMEWKQLRNSKLNIYGLLGLIQGFFVCFGAYIINNGAFAASKTLHHQMLDSVMHLPLQFFEINPIGQIINRFTKDMFIIDMRFHYYLRTWMNCTLDVLGTILVIVGALPLFIIVMIPLVFIYFTIQRYYIASSRQIRRLAGASRSPIISHFSETLSGASTIRAFGHQQRFISQNRDVVNENLVCFYNNIISNRWLSVRLEFLGNLLVFFAALLAVLAGDAMDSATVGLIISYALNITQSLNFWVRKSCEIETNAISIERVFEYTNIKKEAPWVKTKRPPSQWPDKGIVEFINYEARYRPDLGLALQDVTFQTRSEEKIGIVGRTGAGKSTLTNCLFRILEKSNGKIIIDGIDISTIGLHDLRGKLNIIPQDPVLFSGTLQMNLDPLEKYSDNELWEALELCHLKDFVQSLPKRLLHEISEGGENLSVGQRQLICLARALLRKTKILVLDESTASVDYETDNLVQSTIQKEFADCTILTIAHRLHSIMDSERILVLDSGRIIEFETPQNLIRKKGLFSEIVKESGIL
ncbi:ATP-binding cassette sub-family C member 2-like isoform 4-T4 [Sarcophilus harrisii]